MMSFHNSLPSSHDDSFDWLPLQASSISDADLWQTSLQSSDPPSAKYEPINDIVLHPGLVKDDNDALLAAKTSPEPFARYPSQDLTSAVFGGDSTVAAFDIRLNNDIYLNANKETAVNVFPVSPHCVRSAR
jgi:hypothetical protein